MSIDIARLATTVVTSFLMPYVKDGARKLAEAVTEKASKAAAEQVTEVARRIWERVKGVFSSPKEQNTLELFWDDPETFREAVERILREKLKDNTLAQELNDLVHTPSPDGKGTSVQIIAGTAGYTDAREAQISGGIVAGVVINPPPQPQTPSPRDDSQKAS